MNNGVLIRWSALAVAVLFTAHVTDDITRGLDGAGPENLIGFFVTASWLFCALALTDRRYVLAMNLLFSLAGSMVPYLHMRGEGGMLGARIAGTEGTFLWVLCLLALAVASNVSLLASVRGLWLLRAAK